MGKGPSLHKKEVGGVIAFVLERAKQLQTRKFEIFMVELKPLLTGALVEADFPNRIRHKMYKQFRTAKIGQRLLGDRYEFEIDDSIDIKIEKSGCKLSKVETTSSWDKEPFIAPPWFQDLLECLLLGDKPILVGPKGCGKSRILEEAFAHLGRTQYRIPIGQILHPADLIGTKEIVEQNGVSVTKFVGGLITSELDPSRERPGGVIVDELDAANPSVGPALNNIFESGSVIPLQTETGIVSWTPHPQGLIAATANTWGFGDDSGNFAGTFAQNRATWDRLRPKIDVDYDISIERRIVSRHLSPALVEALYSEKLEANKRGLVLKIRERISDKINKMNDTFGLRPIIWFAQRFQKLGWHKSMYYLVNEFKPEYREIIEKIIADRFGHCCKPSRNTWREKINGADDPTFIPKMMPEVIAMGFGHLGK